MTGILLAIRRAFRSRVPALAMSSTLPSRRTAYLAATRVARLYYWVLAAIVVRSLFLASGLKELTDLVAPLWPVQWIDQVGMPAGFYLVASAAAVGAIAAALMPEWRWARLLAFIGFLLLFALENSLGKINHGMHPWIFTSGFLVFLPNGRWRAVGDDRAKRESFLLVFWGAQAAILMFYSMSGLAKAAIGLGQLVYAQVGSFHPMALAHQIAARVGQTNIDPPFADFFLSYPLLGWPLYVGGLYLELFAFVVAFRPRLHRPWGMALIAFHLGIYLTMGVNFWSGAILVAIVLVFSPFRPPSTRWVAVLHDLPLIGAVVRLLAGERVGEPTQPALQR